MKNLVTGITIIVPIFNAESTVAQTLESIIRLQTIKPMQIVLVDDGSEDGSPEIIQEWIEGKGNLFSHITFELIQQPNGGEANAMNRGLQQAIYPIIAWVESDVTIAPDWLNLLLTELDDSVVAGAGGVLYPEEDEPPIARIFGYEITYKITTNDTNPKHITSANALYKKAILDSIGPCRSDLGESSFDSELNQRLRDAGYQLRCNRKAKAWHRFKTTLRGCLERAWWYGLRRPFVKSQILYPFDRIIGILVLAAGFIYPFLFSAVFFPIPALIGIGLILIFHCLYSLFLFQAFRDPVLLIAGPLFLLRNSVFILAYLWGWIMKTINKPGKEPVSC